LFLVKFSIVFGIKMGKSKDEEGNVALDSPKKHKKHKKHRHKREASQDSFSLVSSPDGANVTSPQPSIKLKIKFGGQTFSTQSYTVSSEKELSGTDLIPGVSHCEEVTSDWNESQMSSKKDENEDTSEEEREWLDALEAGDLDDNGELKKDKDKSMLTTRQKALLHGERIEELQELTIIPLRPAILTEEQINRRQMRAKRRREQAQEKTEKDKQETLERLLKKQDSKVKASNKGPAKDRYLNVPVFRYVNSSEAVTLSVPVGYEFPLPRSSAASEPKPVVLCGAENCENPKRYSCSKTGIPLCSLECYRKNLTASDHRPITNNMTTEINAT
jgi:INO80 complex subunit B